MHVLLGVDGTDSSLRALDRTTERAIEASDDLTVAIATDASDDLEDRVRGTLSRAGLDAQIRHLDGEFGSDLVEIAEAEGFDRLVVGGGERSPMGKIDLSHDTQFVLLNAGTTVTLVR
jgi:nucleotide-binding universal stress UspA family protein